MPSRLEALKASHPDFLQRYAFKGLAGCASVDQQKDGAWVKASDAAALVAALEEMEAENEGKGRLIVAQQKLRQYQIKEMVNRFLGWKLPEDFSPDAGISFKRPFNEGTPWPSLHDPIGTNLFTATQAEAMIRYMTEGMQPAEEDSEPGYECMVHGPVCSDPCVWCRLEESECQVTDLRAQLAASQTALAAAEGALDREGMNREQLEECCFTLTRPMKEHPSNQYGGAYDGPCLCMVCRSYAEGDADAQVP